MCFTPSSKLTTVRIWKTSFFSRDPQELPHQHIIPQQYLGIEPGHHPYLWGYLRWQPHWSYLEFRCHYAIIYTRCKITSGMAVAISKLRLQWSIHDESHEPKSVTAPFVQLFCSEKSLWMLWSRNGLPKVWPFWYSKWASSVIASFNIESNIWCHLHHYHLRNEKPMHMTNW